MLHNYFSIPKAIKAFLFLITITCNLPVYAETMSGMGTWESTLHDRDFDGDGKIDGFYDSVLNITWANTQYSPDDSPETTGTWDQVSNWANNLRIGGFSDWRLPTNKVDWWSYPCANRTCGHNPTFIMNGIVYSEMAHLYYATLGNLSPYDENGVLRERGWGLINTGHFDSILNEHYWSDFIVGHEDGSGNAYFFYFGTGEQNFGGASLLMNGLAVHDGDILMVNEPEMSAQLVVGLLFIGFTNVFRRYNYSNRF